MASLIKNQILKHLSKFAKNLNPDQLNLSTFKGEGELSNLELNEDVLMDLLELPSWLRLTKATCNKVAIKVQWTKLKSVPIQISLDEVLVEMESCEELRQTASHTMKSTYGSGGKYGFADMVIDGIAVTVNNVEIKFKFSAFHALFQVSRIRLDSRNPLWHQCDLRMTRLKDPEKGEILTFKMLEWQMLRIEAFSSDEDNSTFTSPLRLITNQARCRITLKKKLQNSALLASRLALIVDDLLWVLTDSQLQAAAHFLGSLSGLIKQSTELDKMTKAARKIELFSVANQSQISQQQSQISSRSQRAISQTFSLFDIVETSFHVYSSRIEIHFCDEGKPGEGRSSHPDLSDGGAMQVSLTRLAFDYYPYHLAIGDRKHWLKYKESNSAGASWVEHLINIYKQQLMNIIVGETPKSKLPRQQSLSSIELSSQDDKRRMNVHGKTLMSLLKQLMASCVILRLDDFAFYQVSTAASRKKVPERFFSSDKSRLMLPSNMPSLHIECTEYYFPGDDKIPVPVPNIHAHLNPVQLTVDPLTVLWLNAFLLGLRKSQDKYYNNVEDVRPMDVRIEALMSRIIVPASKEISDQCDRPRSLQIQISRLTATNSRIGENCGKADLKEMLDEFKSGILFASTSFPGKNEDVNSLANAFYLHAEGKDDLLPRGLSSSSISGSPVVESVHKKLESERFSTQKSSSLCHDLLWNENKTVWCVQLQPVWIDFCGMDNCKTRPFPFMDAVQINLWISEEVVSRCARLSSPNSLGEVSPDCDSRRQSSSESVEKSQSHFILMKSNSLVSLQVNHFQYLFLMRCIEMFTELAESFSLDCEKNAHGLGIESRVCFSAIIPEVNLSFVIPVIVTKLCPDSAVETDLIRADVSSSTVNAGANGPRESGGSFGRVLSTGKLMKESVSDYSITCENSDNTYYHLTSSQSDNALGQLNDKSNGEVCGSDSGVAFTCSSAELHYGNNVRSAVSDGSVAHLRKRSSSPDCQSNNSANGALSTCPSLNAKLLDASDHSPVLQKCSVISGQHSISIEGFTSPLLEKSLEKMPDQLGKTIASGSNAVRKGFSSFMASLDSTLLSSKASLSSASTFPPSDSQSLSSFITQSVDDQETMSICSDLSDSDQFVLLNTEDTTFDDNVYASTASNAAIEVASEVTEDSSSENSAPSCNKRQNLVEIVTFRFGTVEIVNETRGLQATTKLQIHQFGCKDNGKMTWDEFQTKFSSSSRTWHKDRAQINGFPTCDIRMRFERDASVAHICNEATRQGFLEARIANTSLNLLSGSLAKIMDVIEDEVIPLPIPMNVSVKNLTMYLQDERHLAHLDCSKPVIFTIDVQHIIITRTPDGSFHIMSDTPLQLNSSVEMLPKEPQKDGEPSRVNSSKKIGVSPMWSLEDELEEKVFHLQEENEQLRLKLIAMENVHLDNKVERVNVSDYSEELSKAKNEIQCLTREKQLLLKDVQFLKNQLSLKENFLSDIDGQIK